VAFAAGSLATLIVGVSPVRAFPEAGLLLAIATAAATMLASAGSPRARTAGCVSGLLAIAVSGLASPGTLLAYAPWAVLCGAVSASPYRSVLLGALGSVLLVASAWLSGWALPPAAALGAAGTLELVHAAVALAFGFASEQARLALTDPVTGLANRRAIEAKLRSEIARAKRNSGRVSLVFLDLIGFKAVNNGWGHRTGDAVLARVAHELAGCVRPYDLVGRPGGDEFVVVLPGVGPEEVERTAVRLLRTVERVPAPVPLGACAGWAVAPDDSDDPNTLMHAADPKVNTKLRSTGTAGGDLS